MSLTFILIAFSTGLLAGTVDAIAGGGGLISVPLLLCMGLPPQVALGTNKLQSLCGTAVAAYSYHRRGWLAGKGLLQGLFFCIIGAVFGALATQMISNHSLKIIIPFILLVVFLYVLLAPRLGHQDQAPKLSAWVFYLVFGSLLGFYDGFLGPGVGGFWVFALMYFLGFNLLKATAYTKVFNLNSNIIAMLCFAYASNIDYRIGVCMACGQLLGGRLGAQFAMNKGVKLVRPLFLFMMFVSIMTLLYKNDSPWVLALVGVFIIAVWGVRQRSWVRG